MELTPPITIIARIAIESPIPNVSGCTLLTE